MAVVGSALSLSPALPASAQQSAAGIGLTGRVSPALKLSLGRGWQAPRETRVAAQEITQNVVQVTLAADGSGGASQITIPIEIRTNVAYHLKVSLVASDSCLPAITASVISARASGQLVRVGAAENARPLEHSALTPGGLPHALLAGPKTSAGGTFTTPTNALLVELSVVVPAHTQSCGWHASLNLSLQQSA